MKQSYFPLSTFAIVSIIGFGFITYRSTIKARYSASIADIEQKSIKALQIFENDQTESLLTALEAGQQLQNLINQKATLRKADESVTSHFSTEDYPTLSPINTLDKILRHIQEQPIISPYINNMADVALHDDGQILALTANQQIIGKWELNGTPISPVEHSLSDNRREGKNSRAALLKHPETSTTGQPTWTFNGQTLWTKGGFDILKAWNREGKLLHVFDYGLRDSYSATDTPSNAPTILWNEWQNVMVIPNNRGSELMLWHPERAITPQLDTQQSRVLDLSWTPDDEILATAGMDGTVKLWSSKGTLLNTLQAHNDQVYALSWNADGSTLATSGGDGTIKLWKPDGALSQTIKTRFTPLKLGWSQDSKQLIAYSLNSNNATDILNTDGRLVASNFNGDLTQSVTSEEESTNLEKLSFRQHLDSITRYQPNRINFDFLGTNGIRTWTEGYTAIATYDVPFSPLQIKYGNNSPVNIPNAHQGYIYAMEWNHTGDVLATGGTGDGFIKLWNRHGNLLISLRVHSSGVEHLSWSSDGKRIAIASSEGIVKILPVHNFNDLLAQSCDWLNGYLIGQPSHLQALPVCQTSERKQASAYYWLDQGRRLAAGAEKRADKAKAIKVLNTAKEWAPNFDIDPKACVKALSDESRRKASIKPYPDSCTVETVRLE